MEAPTPTVTVLENCRVSPPPEAVAEISLPLTFFDIIWLTFHPITRVIFYNFPCSTTQFTQKIVPNLKTSLSLALKHFSPFAGNLISPSNLSAENPQIRYVDGDAISVTFAECTTVDYNHLSGNHIRDADVLSPFVPQIPPSSTDESGGDYVVAPVFGIQVTIFPDRGISIGLTNSHVVADGNAMFNFVRAWSSIAKELGGGDDIDDKPSISFPLPFYDRSVVKDTMELGTMFRRALGSMLEQLKNFQPPQQASTKKVRATFIVNQADIQALKNLVSTKRPTLTHVSSFTVVCAYLWTCMAKTRATVEEGTHNLDEPQHFGFAMDCRARLDPPIPETYFGNCLVPVHATVKGTELVGEDGLVIASELTGEAIRAKVQKKEGGVLKGADKWFEEFAGTLRGEWTMGIAGSPKMDYYNTIDFGWGKPDKFEFVGEPVSLSRCKDSQGDLEIGLVLPENEMDVFSTVFPKGIRDLCDNL